MKEVYSAEIVEAFEVVGNSDDCEGRGVDVILGVFLGKLDAEVYARGKGPMGCAARVRNTQAVKFHTGEAYVLGKKIMESPDLIEKERKRILSQLSFYDKQILGIKE